MANVFPPCRHELIESVEKMVVFGNELYAIGFIASLWITEKVAVKMGLSPLVANIVFGILLGPALADMVPYPDAFKLFGKLGILLLIVDGTLTIDMNEVKKIGVRALLAAALGVAGPVGLCMLFVSVVFGRSWKTGLATGAAIAPTSLGFSAKLLQESNQLTSSLGQLICVAAVFDDVISLCLLSELKVINGDSQGAWDIARPLVASAGSILIGAVFALLIMPRLLPTLLQALPEDAKLRGYILLFLLFGFSTASAFLSALAGSSDLLGCFCGVLPFSEYSEVKSAWKRFGLPKVVGWGGRLFFASTIGFGVPKVKAGSGNLLDGEALWKGLVLGAVGLVGKFLVGLLAHPLTCVNAVVFGWAMQGRGEFSFILADESATEGLFEENTSDFPSVIWGLLICCISAPVFFRFSLKYAPAPVTSPSIAASLPTIEDEAVRGVTTNPLGSGYHEEA